MYTVTLRAADEEGEEGYTLTLSHVPASEIIPEEGATPHVALVLKAFTKRVPLSPECAPAESVSPEQYASQQYNLFITDISERVTLDEMRAGQPIINYFAGKLREHFAREAVRAAEDEALSRTRAEESGRGRLGLTGLS